ncbi:MAG TPA: helix-turn-helix transcriptional regulator [Vicinamibacterales bacterium]|nr:helix-turn-helix transcriptional regulator [Vicinamibacterales bacterium]
MTARSLLTTQLVAIRDVQCEGRCRHHSDEECTRATHLVFPYRGLYVRHLGGDDAVAEANQLLFFNADEGYRVSHPVPGGDASLDLVLSEPILDELAPSSLLREGGGVAFRQQRLRVDPRAQALAALLRHTLRTNVAEPLEAESLALTLARRALGPRSVRTTAASAVRQRLVNRTKVVLASDLTRRWTLAEIAVEVGHSPVYLTQLFQQVEGVPLYRYQMQLRLARSLELLSQYDDLTSLSLDLGFYSHSHFSTAFKQAYGRSPSAFRLAALHR